MNLFSEEFSKYINETFLSEDLLTIDYQNIKATIVIKNLNYTARRIEYYSLMFAVFYYIALFAVFYFAYNEEGNE